jgi:hypothetical protein
MKYPCRLILAVLLLGLALPASAAIKAWLDRDRIGPGDTVQLTLEHDGRTDSQPDLTPLKQNFDILGQSSGSSIQIVNGSMTAKVQISLALAPRLNGQLLVPPLRWDGQTSPALTLTVSGNSAPAQGGNAAPADAAHTFITTTLDQKQPYVQAAVTLTVRLYVDQSLAQASLELEPSNDLLIQQIGQDRQTSETRNGRNYQVVERKYLLFPQRSGHIQIDGPVLNAQVRDARGNDPFGSDPFFGNVFGSLTGATRPLRLRGDPIVLDVRPRPASGAGHDWLPAQKVTLTETWQPASGPYHAGDPITRRLHLDAQGLTASQLPDLSLLMPLPRGLRAYPDQPKLNTGVQGDGVVGSRDQDIALIASQAGRYQLPALKLFWWDTTKNVQREVDLPVRTIDVLPNGQGFSASTMPPDQSASPPAAKRDLPMPGVNSSSSDTHWPWISLALALLWLGTLFAWWRSRKRPLPGPVSTPVQTADSRKASDARKAFRQACRENDPQAARRHLLAWARIAWPEAPPLGLGALARCLNDPELETALNQLDRACYAGGAWSGQSLLEKLTSLSGTSRPVAGAMPELAGLYPS